MKDEKEGYNPYTYKPIISVSIHLNMYYKDGGQVGKEFKSIEEVAEFFKEQPSLRKHFTRAGQAEKLDRGEDLDGNF